MTVESNVQGLLLPLSFDEWEVLHRLIRYEDECNNMPPISDDADTRLIASLLEKLEHLPGIHVE